MNHPETPQQPKKKMRKGFVIFLAVLAVVIVWVLLALLFPSPFAKPFVWLYARLGWAPHANYETTDLTGEIGTVQKITFTDEGTEQPLLTETGEPAVPWTIDVVDRPVNADGLPLICNTEDVLNVLVIGLDYRDVDGPLDEASPRSDSIILVSLNTKEKTITLTSFLRDYYLRLSGAHMDKLGHAYAYGKAPLLIQTLKDNFNVQIDYYVYLNFYSFVDIAEAMGGLDVEMTPAEVKTMNFYLQEINENYKRPYGTDNLPVPQVKTKFHLNGYQLLGYVRNRYDPAEDGSNYDWARTYRQRHTLDLMKEKAKTLSLSQLDQLAKLAMTKLYTNMDENMIASLIMNAMDYMKYSFSSQAAPPLTGDSAYNVVIDGVYKGVGAKDIKKTMQDVYRAIYGEDAPAN